MSFRGRLKEHSIVLDKVVHFGRVDAPGEVCPYSSSAAMGDARRRFVESVARCLGIQRVSYYVPPGEGEYLEGIMKIDKHTLVFDTTFNNSILKVIQEANLEPGVIIKQFRFWRDEADEDVETLKIVRER
jgi:hypothetical protein